MGIRLTNEQLQLVLDDAIALARSSEEVTRIWRDRAERVGSFEARTYVAALGAALLAKAADDRVDSLARTAGAGVHGYSLRKVGEFLAARNHGRYHMGTSSQWPLNNSPFYRAPARIDEFTNIGTKEAFEFLRDCLRDLNRLTAPQARRAFAEWLRVRMAVAASERQAEHQVLGMQLGLDPEVLLRLAEAFVAEDPEGGRRGQAFVAAALDCAFDDVFLQPINHPGPGDVQVRSENKPVWIVEVKQAPVNEQVALTLAANARKMGVSLALLVVLSTKQHPLDRDSVRRHALREHRVMLEVCESVRELLGTIGIFSTTPVERIVEQLPTRYAIRMREHGVSSKGQLGWAELLEARKPVGPAASPGAS